MAKFTIWDIINEENINAMRPVEFVADNDIMDCKHNFYLDKQDIDVSVYAYDETTKAPIEPSEIEQIDKMTLRIDLGGYYSTVATPAGQSVKIVLRPNRY